MSGLQNGDYRTEAGSRVTISGDHAGIHDIWFDWVEERACPDAKPHVENCDGVLRWHCGCHDEGQAELLPLLADKQTGAK